NQQWLSSDYYFQQLGLDPSVTQKRLGDGFYEQKLIKEQLIGLTGRAVLEYPDAQSQYRALMQAGAAYAKQLQLAPGIALSAAQVAQLSSDVVILQEAQVNGQVVLVPVVYLSPNQGQRLLPTGSLIAANNIELTNSQSITNSGTIRAQQNLSLDALNIDSRGGKLQSGGLMQLTSQKDIDLTSATLKAGSLRLDAGKNILLNTDATQVRSAVQGGSRVSTQLGQIASIAVQGDALIKSGANFEQNAGTLTIGGNLQTHIGGNWTLGAVQSSETTQAQTASGHSNTEVVQQRTSSLTVGGQSNLQVANNFTAQGAAITLQGPAALQIGGNLTLSAVKDSINVDSASASSHHQESTQSFNETLRGSSLQAGNNLTLSAGQDLTLSASRINVSQGSATLLAGGNVKIETDTERHQSDKQHTGSHAGLLTSTTIADHHTSERTDNIASAINATAVTVIAGQDLLVSGSSLSSQTATTLIAGNKLIISAAQNSSSESHERQESETGLMVSLDRIDLRVEQGRARQSSQTTQAISRISSQGDTSLIAGNQLGVYASALSAGNTLSLQGADLTLLGGLNASSASEQDSSKHSGTSIGYHDPGKGLNAHEAGTQDKAQTTLVATTLSGQNIQLKATGDTGSNGSITLAGVQATTTTSTGTLSLDAGSQGTLNLNNASTESSQANSHTSSDIVYQKMQGQGSQQESGHANVLKVGQLNINAATINVPLAQSLQQLTQQPGMDYLSQLLKDPQLQGKVNWSAVELAHQNWNYEQQGLTQAGAVIVAIVVAYFTAGAASGVGVSAAEGAGFATTTTAAGTTVMTTTAGSMVAGATAAAVTTLATQASISLINNQGDIGKTLNDLGSSDNVKGLVTAMLTGGALAGLNFSPTGQPTVNGGAQSFSSQLGKNLQAGVARSLISTAINGGSLEDSLKTAIASAFLDTAAAQGAFAIGELKNAGTLDAFTHKLAHALAGCAAGAARAGAGEGCAAGAIGAAVGEMAAEAYGRRADTVEFAAMISGIAAAVAGGDASQINLASQAGANAAANNYLNHAEATARAALKDKQSKGQLTAVEQQKLNNLEVLDIARDLALRDACQTQGDVCNAARRDVNAAIASYAGAPAMSNPRLSSAGNAGVTAELNQNIQLANDPNLAQQTTWDSFKEFAVPQLAGYAAGAVIGKYITEAQAVYAAIKGESTAVTATTTGPIVNGKLSNSQPINKVVFNGVELDPNLPPPVAGYGYSPTFVKGATTDNAAYAHLTGFQSEVKLANEVAGQGQAVVKWGDKIGTNGSDVISVNPSTGDVVLWDSKYRTATTGMDQSPTFANATTRNQAIEEAKGAIDASNLPSDVRAKAISNLEKQNFTTNTVGAGGVKNSVQIRYCGNKPC
ncbi:MAG: DUF637 domain-containing protein, partial [Burkholderiaceae bacterium]|nr:DUF637 domain-containing protein [Burkholderiaceae bacterium]